MLSEIPLQTNLYNFSLTVPLDGRQYSLRFNYSRRREFYILDILDDGGNILDSGLLCAVEVQLNRRIVHIMRGSLLFLSSDKSISYANRTGLGTIVRLFHYLPDVS